MVVLLTALGLVVGGTAEIYLHKTLYERLDDQVQEASDRALGMGPGHGGGGPYDRQRYWQDRPAPGAGAGSIAVFFLANTDGSVTQNGGGLVVYQSTTTTDESADPRPNNVYGTLPAEALTQLAGVQPGGFHSVSLEGLTDYRVYAVTTPDGMTLVTALKLDATRSTLLKVAGMTSGAVLITLIIAGWAGAVIIRRTLKPLNRVAATATRVSELKLDRGEVELAQRVPESDTDPRTEVGAVGAALNRMLDHVGSALEARHASETQVRQFVADASHELRTPLAAIRGYAELSRRSRQPVPDEVSHVLRRVESEALRMTALVEDLLLLARLDAGRPLAHEPVDLTMLVVDAVSDAHAAGPGHDWQLDLPDEPVSVLGDGQRLHQVLANLLANARTHTPEGTTVVVGVAAEADAAVLRVTDFGPGIPAELQPHIFERFARGDSSRSRAAGSTGLGLSIVHAVVSAHQGTVGVRSVPGRTEFTVRLPLVESSQTASLQAEPEPIHQHVAQVVQ
nr:HAMP domain-containing sensor histidine kinase [Actinoplanes sp. TFC3]